MEHQPNSSAEKPKSREVFTDESVVIGPDSSVETLEAFPITCAIFTAYSSSHKVLGMAHISLGIYQEGVNSLIGDLSKQLKVRGVDLTNCRIDVFNAGDILLEEINTFLESKKIPPVESKMLQDGFIKIDKETGTVE